MFFIRAGSLYKTFFFNCLVIWAVILLFGIRPCAADNTESPPTTGNFALPSSQQPAPLMSFGEDIVDKNTTQFFLYADDFVAVNQHFVDVIPSFLYGITDNLSIFINVPYAAHYQSNTSKSSGLEDASAQLEYGFYSKSTTHFVEQATVVVSASIPSGSINKNPSTGLGSPSFFLGTTYNRTYVDWFVFGSPGVQLTSAHNGTQVGNSYLYQLGLGRNIMSTNQWILAWMTEINGTYSQRNRVNDLIDPNSGGNLIYVVPSLWASSRHFIFQAGAGWPVVQNFNGNQPREKYLLVAGVVWTV